MLEVFRNRKMAALLLLGFASGMPLYVTSRMMQAWLFQESLSLTAIGAFSLIALPYSLKFLWSPVLDRYSLGPFGRRKGWILASQAGLFLSIAGMSMLRPSANLPLFAAAAVVIAFMSATQDIVVDAYRADILEPHETGAGAGIGVLGYRLAMILTGSIALSLADWWSWPTVYAMTAGVMALVALASTRVAEPSVSGLPPQSLSDAVRLPFVDFFNRKGALRATLILLFVVLYRLGDSMIGNMTTPFLLQTGFTQTSIGAIQGGVGLIATIAGVLLGGAILSRIGTAKSLWVFGILQAASNLAYLALAQVGHHYGLMVATILVENVCTGLGTAALVGFLISLCNPRFSATQYALLSSLMAVGRDVLMAPTGFLAQMAGWPLFFLISFVAAFPGLALLPVFAPWNEEPAD